MYVAVANFEKGLPQFAVQLTEAVAGVKDLKQMLQAAEEKASIAMGDIDPRTRRLAHCRCDLRSDGIGFAFVGKEQPFIWPEP